jgi:hypothetical protein
MQDLHLALQKQNSSRAEKRKEMTKIGYYQKLFRFLESRFEDGETYAVKNYFETFKMVAKDQDGNDKTVYGLICENGRSYLSLNDLAFAKKLYRREIKKEDGTEITEYTQLPDKVQQGDLGILFHEFKTRTKDALTAFDLLYIALAKHNKSKFIAEAFVYPTETFQRFKGDYTTSNFYLFNLQAGGTDKDDLLKIIDDVMAIYEQSLNEPEPAAAE